MNAIGISVGAQRMTFSWKVDGVAVTIKLNQVLVVEQLRGEGGFESGKKRCYFIGGTEHRNLAETTRAVTSKRMRPGRR